MMRPTGRWIGTLLLLLCTVAAQLPVGDCCVAQIKEFKNKVVATYDKALNFVQGIKGKFEVKKPKYVGCFTDRDDNRDVQFIGARQADMKKEVCNDICKDKYPMTNYFGLQNGNLCFCGNDYGNYGVKRDGHCDKPCEGDKSQTCGGVLLNSVYEILR